MAALKFPVLSLVTSLGSCSKADLEEDDGDEAPFGEEEESMQFVSSSPNLAQGKDDKLISNLSGRGGGTRSTQHNSFSFLCSPVLPNIINLMSLLLYSYTHTKRVERNR